MFELNQLGCLRAGERSERVILVRHALFNLKQGLLAWGFQSDLPVNRFETSVGLVNSCEPADQYSDQR